MKRVFQTALGMLCFLAVVSVAVAQQTPQPVVRLGNWIEVGNDVFMHIIATADIRYKTSHNADFESRVRDRALSRNPSNTAQHEQEGDLSYAELRFGVDFRYQKNLNFHLLFENQSIFDGNLIDDRANTSNPGGTDVFGRAASTENPGFRVERFTIRYQFPGTPILLHVGPDLWAVSQAGILSNDNPRIAVEGNFGKLKVWASAVIERESQRLGLQNDNDSMYYVFGGIYDAKPHKFGMDVVWFRDRFAGADTAVAGNRPDIGWTGQKVDSVWVNASWSGKMGPIRGLVQGNVLVGTARGSTVRGSGATGLPTVVPLRREYDIFAASAIAYLEAELGMVRPFVGLVYGSGDGDARDNKLHGFQTQNVADSNAITSNGFFNHLDTSVAFAHRDYSCPGLAQISNVTQPAGTTRNPYAVGRAVLGAGGGGTECSHTTSNVYNSRLGITSHLGILTTYSNPGTLVIPVGIRLFPMKGHEITGWYVYRAMIDSSLLDTAFAPELRGQKISKSLYHGVGGFWMWTLNPHFDIRLDGEIGIPAAGYKDLAQLADCNPNVAGTQACDGNDPALRAGVRVRARF